MPYQLNGTGIPGAAVDYYSMNRTAYSSTTASLPNNATFPKMHLPMKCIALLAFLFHPRWVSPFTRTTSPARDANKVWQTCGRSRGTFVGCNGSNDSNDLEVLVSTQLDDEKVTSLFAWVSLAFRGDPGYNNLMLAIAAIFGNLPPTSVPVQMAEKARELLPPEEELVGDSFSIEEREYNSLGCVTCLQNLVYSV